MDFVASVDYDGIKSRANDVAVDQMKERDDFGLELEG
jgi:hypothetical protein